MISYILFILLRLGLLGRLTLLPLNRRCWLDYSGEVALGHLPGHTDQQDDGGPEHAPPEVASYSVLEPVGVASQAHRSHGKGED